MPSGRQDSNAAPARRQARTAGGNDQWQQMSKSIASSYDTYPDTPEGNAAYQKNVVAPRVAAENKKRGS